MAANIKTAVGSCFGEWTVTSRTRESYVMCKCRCGTEREVHISNLTSGKTKSCGCCSAQKIAKAKTKHGMFGTPTYSSWSSMMTRCYNKKSKAYIRYGAKGIVVCEKWHDFKEFLLSMGEKPCKGMSIERIDNSGNYEPSNCIWATNTIQMRNTSRTKLSKQDVLAIRNGTVSCKELIKKTGCSKSTVGMAKRGENWKEI